MLVNDVRALSVPPQTIVAGTSANVSATTSNRPGGASAEPMSPRPLSPALVVDGCATPKRLLAATVNHDKVLAGSVAPGSPTSCGCSGNQPLAAARNTGKAVRVNAITTSAPTPLTFKPTR